MKERRGWLWLASGVLLAVVAGLLTFQIVSELAVSASLAGDEDSPMVAVIVAVTEIPAFTAINTGMVTIQNVPATLVPEDFSSNIEDIIGATPTTNIAAGEILLNSRLVDPLDPDAPVLYTMDAQEVLVTIPAHALISHYRLLSVGDRVDVAFTSEFLYDEESVKVSAGEDNDPILTSFLSLQNLEVKGLLHGTPTEEGITPRPEAIMLAVAPQEALILKYLIDAGAPMDLFLRSPVNQSLLTIVPVDEQYLIDYFQLDLDAPVEFVGGNRTTASAMGDENSGVENTLLTNSDSGTAVTSLLQDQLQNRGTDGDSTTGE